MTVAREQHQTPREDQWPTPDQRAGDRRSSERRSLTRTVDDERRSGARRLAPSRRSGDYRGDLRSGRDRRRFDRRSSYPVNPLEERRVAERRASADRRCTPARGYIPGVFIPDA